MAAARGRRQSRSAADHVRHRRRAAADEWAAPWLPGYENSAPVRIGNAAHSQLQLDVFGEIMDAHHQARRGGLSTNESRMGRAARVSRASARRSGASPTRASGRCAAPPRHFTYSKVMAWVAFDRAIKSAETFGLGRAARRLAQVARGDLRRGVRRGFDQELGTFVQAYGSKQLDASLLLHAGVGFLPVVGSAHGRHHRGDRAASAARRLRHALRHRARSTTACRRARARFSLAASGWSTSTCCRALDDAERLFRPAGRAAQRSRPVERGIRSARQAAGRQFPAGLFASGAGQQRLQSDAHRKPVEQRAQADTSSEKAAADRGPVLSTSRFS